MHSISKSVRSVSWVNVTMSESESKQQSHQNRIPRAAFVCTRTIRQPCICSIRSSVLQNFRVHAYISCVRAKPTSTPAHSQPSQTRKSVEFHDDGKKKLTHNGISRQKTMCTMFHVSLGEFSSDIRYGICIAERRHCCSAMLSSRYKTSKTFHLTLRFTRKSLGER